MNIVSQASGMAWILDGGDTSPHWVVQRGPTCCCHASGVLQGLTCSCQGSPESSTALASGRTCQQSLPRRDHNRTCSR